MRALGRVVGVSQSHISRVVAGKLPASGDFAASVAQALGLPIDYFPDYREAQVINAVRSDGKIRDRLYRSLQRPG